MKENVTTQRAEIKLPEYKGHTKITLTNVETGEEEIIEKDNIVTNAVRDFFAQDAFGLFDLNNSNLTPLRNMFGGVFCFENAIEANPDKYTVPSEGENPLIAHAGQTGHNTPSTKRGNPNGELSGETSDGKGYKFVWDFAVNQGVGQISTVCLTHQLSGDNGTLPIAEFNQNLIPRIDFSATWAKAVQHGTREVAINKPCIYDPETRQGIALFFSASNKLDVIKVQGDSYKLGLNDEVLKFREISSTTLTVYRNASTAFADALTSMFVDGNFIYIYGLSSTYTTTIYYVKIDVSETPAIAETGTWNISKRAFMSSSNKLWKVHPRYPFNNGWLYLPAYDQTEGGKFTFLRFDITRASTTCEVLQDSNIEVSDWNWTDDNYKSICPINVSNDFIIGGHYVINSGVVRKTPYWSTNNGHTAAQVFGKSSMIVDINTNISAYSGAVLNPYYLATINVLDTPVTKQNNQTMKIEYEIKEA